MGHAPPQTLFTAGTGNRSLQELVALVREHGVELLVDVRRWPSSRRHPHFCREALEQTLPQSGLAYLWLGEELGGYRRGGYQAHMEGELFKAGLSRLERLAAQRATAIFCAELDPDGCHRRFIADALVARGWQVVHLLRPGDTRTHSIQPRQEELRF